MTTLEEIRKVLGRSENPLFFYDDDPDGTVSYLLLRRWLGRGNGVIIRVRGTRMDEEELYLSKIIEFRPDVVVFLDKPTLDQEMFDKIKVKKIWIDHHDVVDVKGVYYHNPRMKKKSDNRPTSYLCYKITKKDLWLASVGVTADWSLALFKEFKKKYPGLVKKVELFKDLKPDDVLFNTKLGELARIFSFMLKGKTLDVKRSINGLLKINDPFEILEGKSEEGKRLFENAKIINKKYKVVLNSAISLAKKSKRVIFFNYVSDKITFTSDLANELLHRFPGKIVAVCRAKDEQVRVSLRSSKDDVELPKIIDKICLEIKAGGGGHEHAAAIAFHKEEFNKFKDLLEEYAG
jgi:single-stranded DNA-specific DHH superfamily exonuclease